MLILRLKQLIKIIFYIIDIILGAILALILLIFFRKKLDGYQEISHRFTDNKLYEDKK